MASRLDRLILLLDAGSTPAVRSAAAQQIGDIYKHHPGELGNLLSRVLVHLQSKKWETRTAAGQAVAAIAANVPPWDSVLAEEPEGGGVDGGGVPVDSAAQALTAEQRGWLSFDKFDVLQVLRHGRQLLGSAGKEYDVDWGNMTPEQRLKMQKKNLKERLGMASQFMEEDILADDDILNMPVLAGGAGDSSKVSKETEIITAGLSARERNRLKRKAKKDAKEQGKDKVRVVDLGARRESAANTSASPTALKVEQDAVVTVTPQPCSDKMVVESNPLKNLAAESGVEWPFEPVCEVLCLDVFDPSWEVRHGAGIGLREILKTHGAGAGKMLGVSAAENVASHRAWLEDCAVRLLCAFALDRFGDFVSDQVVAPVRETCAQALGALLRHMPGDIVLRVQEVLLCLIMQDNFGPGHSEIWEVRHAGLLGLKYAVAVRVDLVQTMLGRTVDAVVLGLQDADDDVRAVSASTLLPIAEQFVQYLPNRILKVLSVLWDCLNDLKDDLTASTASVMDLLAKLFSIPAVLKYMQEEGNSRSLANLIPRIYPFFRHTIYSVRVAVLNTLLTLVTKSDADREQLAWVDDNCLRLLFQNMVVETKEDIVALSLQVWSAIIERARENPERVTSLSGPHIRGWFAVLTTPINVPIDSRLLYSALSSFSTAPRAQSSGSARSSGSAKPTDGRVFSKENSDMIIRGRVAAATALGKLLGVWNHEEGDDTFEMLLLDKLDSSLVLSRQLAGVALEEWAVFSLGDDATADFTKQNRLAAAFHARCCSILETGGSLVIPEEKAALASVRGDCKALLDVFAAEDGAYPVSIPALQPLETLQAVSPSFTVEAARAVAGETCDALLAAVKSKKVFAAVAPKVEDLRKGILGGAEQLAVMRRRAETGVLAAIAAAVVAMGNLPDKLNPVIRAVMSAVKAEENLNLQRRAGVTLSRMVSLFASGSSRSNPTDKIIKNLCTFLCADASVTPLLEANPAREGILSLDASSSCAARTSAAAGSAKRLSLAGLTDADVESMEIAVVAEDETATAREARLRRRGAHIALCEVAKRFGEHAVDRLPVLWSCMAEALEGFLEVPEDPKLAGGLGQNVVDALQVVSTLVPVLHPALHDKVASLLPCIVNALKVPSVVVRNMAARALAVLCKVITVATMNAVIRDVVPFLGDTANVTHRQGAVEAVYCIIGKMESAILPYVIFLVVPILGRMSDSDEAVRVVATNCFATLIKLVPLESGIPDPPGLPAEMLAHREKERSFLAQLMDSSKLEPFEIPVMINADLRKYQQEGVNWMAFLNKYQLHGILCDDMGLGKTLQSICILASDHYLRAEKHKQSKSPDSAALPSLVVCPPTLTGHWEHEIKSFAPFLRPMCYCGGPNDRRALLKWIPRHDVVIISYEILRNDIGELSKFNYNYCILDEGHIIKNAKTKLTKAIKSVWANHRLILSGTPVQNNVLELWSLFDFLMPGFLGTEKMFNERFSRPILASRDAKSSSREQEAGAVALEALHKQVLPFLLRRLKEDVLSDLPPKIIQDYHCELSSIQKRIYNTFARSQAKSVISGDIVMGADEEMSSESKQGKATHVFQGLQYLRKLCNHPLLVLNENHPDYAKITDQVKAEKKSLHDLVYAPKLIALKELLQACGIGVVAAGASTGDSNGDLTGVDTVSQHRVLIFCQLKTMLDIIEQDLFKRHMPTVSYMRLDGSTEASKRHGIVQKFNADPSIDVLLLTTHVGGLGLNLTGADTVIFVEHDWNPMRDLQAMDRAHRIGQKKVVNVYRLITRGTLEEKIMGLQKFKLNIAATVINQQNAGLQSMGTDHILDLFSVTEETDEGADRRRAEQGGRPEDGKRATSKSVLENLQELWDESQYKEEYNLDGFIDSLKK